MIPTQLKNRFLYSFYKNKFIKKAFIKIKMKSNKNYKDLEIKKQKDKILEQIDRSIKKVSEKYKKYNII